MREKRERERERQRERERLREERESAQYVDSSKSRGGGCVWELTVEVKSNGCSEESRILEIKIRILEGHWTLFE